MVEYNRIQIDGSLGLGAERWSSSFAVGNGVAAVSDPGDLNVWAEAIRTLWATDTDWAPTLKSLLSTGGSIDKIRVYGYPADGPPAFGVGESTGAVVGGTGSGTLPPQISLVFGLRTGIPGRRFRGRMYWPCMTGSTSSSLKRSGTPAQATIAAAVALMLRDCADLSPLESTDPVVVSAAGGFDITSVISVAVGDVYDTQRRRRDALVETYTTAPVP